MNHWLLAAWLTTCSADAVTTHVALNRGAHELLTTQHPWTNDAIVAGQATALVWSVNRLRRNHPKLALGLLIGLTVVRGAAAVHNIHVLGELR